VSPSVGPPAWARLLPAGLRSGLLFMAAKVKPSLVSALQAQSSLAAQARWKTTLTELRAYKAAPDRERLSNDMINTGVSAALIGGFALSNLQNLTIDKDDTNWLPTVVYCLSCFAVHACTCSALTSAILYGRVNFLDDNSIEAWGARSLNKMVLSMPLWKFAMGCAAYIISVIILSFHDLDGIDGAQGFCLTVGIMSMMSVVMTVGVLMLDMPRRSAAPSGASAESAG